ncbi:MAG: zinc ribbon domain-containing protein [Anaerolineae bacterium]|nr:zinc ribbon domain-containing protein [Anaerolineae bacterium]
MPLYEYRCDECGVRFEHRQHFSDSPITECPECGGSVHRVIGSTGVIFKGSGFYVTDNRKSGGRTEAKPSGSGKSEGAEAKSEGKSEAKTEATATKKD